MFHWGFALHILPKLLQGLWLTVQLTVIGMAVACVLGLIWAVARRSPIRLIAWPVAVLVEFIRSTPLLVQVYFLYYALPNYGVRFPTFITGVAALGLHYSAYTSEVYRAGINSVPRGQWDAAVALNLSPLQRFKSIILPQALPPVLPALGNYLVSMFKDTPILYTITLMELMGTAMNIGSQTFRYLEPLTLVGLLFLVVSLLAAALLHVMEMYVFRVRV